MERENTMGAVRVKIIWKKTLWKMCKCIKFFVHHCVKSSKSKLNWCSELYILLSVTPGIKSTPFSQWYTWTIEIVILITHCIYCMCLDHTDTFSTRVQILSPVPSTAGQDVMLNCSISKYGYPEKIEHYEWFRDDKILHNSNKFGGITSPELIVRVSTVLFIHYYYKFICHNVYLCAYLCCVV